MGSGKTQFCIQKMNEEDKRFIYITPFLSEVERVKNGVNNKRFYEPIQLGNGKLKSFKDLLIKGCNITSTHSLFSSIDDETRELIRSQSYTLILDEVMDVIEPYTPISNEDYNYLVDSKFIEIDENTYCVKWLNDNYTGRFNDIKYLANQNRLMLYNKALLFWCFPADIFSDFEEVFVLTYKFKGQIMKYYYDLYNLEYSYNSIANVNNRYELIDFLDDKNSVTKLINILYDTKLNAIGDNKFALSATWYDNNFNNNKGLFVILKNNISNFFKNKCCAKSNDVLWTCYIGKDNIFVNQLKSKGYSSESCFAPVNSRATNIYSGRHYVSYTVNRFMNPLMKNIFTKKGMIINEDEFALSEMLQFIFRSAIRKGEKITIYIPSSRMRKLLEEWINC